MIYLYEIKKIIKSKLFIVSFLCAVFLCFVLCFLEISTHGYYVKEGDFKTGISSIQKLSAQRTSLNTELNDEFLQDVYKRYHEIMSNPSNFNTYKDLDMHKVGNEWQKYSNLFELLTRSYSEFQQFDGKNLMGLQEEDIHVQQIFQSRVQQIQTITTQKGKNGEFLYNQKQRNRILNMSTINPSQKYEDATGWNIVFLNQKTLNITICILATMIGSRLFSKEIQQGTSSVLFTSSKGRSKSIIMKLFAAFSVLCICAIVLNLLYISLMFSIFSTSGLSTIIQYQAMYWLSIYPFTNIEAYMFLSGMGFCGSTVMLMIASFCSRYTRKDYIALTFSLLFLLVPLVINIPYPIFPAGMVDANMQLMTISLHTLGNVELFDYEIQMITTIGSLFMIFLIFHSYHKKKGILLLE